ncbi:MAG: glucosaminidase domain-containing protein [Pseudanabaena sp.]|jgi:hypothetical protein
MRRKQFLQIGSGAIAIFTLDRIFDRIYFDRIEEAVQAQSFVSLPMNSTENITKSSTKICAGILTGKIDRIMADGLTSEVQLLRLLQINKAPLNLYGDLPNIYRQEAAIEGVNYDIAFCQMCLETGFLQFDGDVKPDQNNFGGIGAIGNGVRGDSFSDRRIGVRAQIQHLKAYATTKPLIQPLVDPRFSLVKRGTAPLLGQLVGRWAEDLNYDKKIMAILRRLYELSGFF